MADKEITAILDKTLAGTRLSKADALLLWQRADFKDLGNAAHEVRNRLNPPREVSFTAYRVVNYTNYCNVECSFCSFMDEVGSGKGYTLSKETILTKVAEAVALDSPQLFLQGGVNPDLPMAYYLDTLSAVRDKFPDVHIRAFSPVESLFMESLMQKPLAEVLPISKKRE